MEWHNVKKEEIIAIAKEAGDRAMRFYNTDYKITQKKDNTPVTDADIAVHTFLCERLAHYGYPILSEENERIVDLKKSAYIWIIDPIDGTIDFIEKNDQFSIMIGLADAKGKSVLGVIYAPALGEMYFAQKDKGAFFVNTKACSDVACFFKTKKRINVNQNSLQNGTLLISRHYSGGWEKEVARKYVMHQKPMGSVGIKMCKIAAGAAELYINSSNKCALWDVCAGDVIVREAGGHICNTMEKEILYNVANVKLANGYVVSNVCAKECIHIALAHHTKNCNKSKKIFKKILI